MFTTSDTKDLAKEYRKSHEELAIDISVADILFNEFTPTRIDTPLPLVLKESVDYLDRLCRYPLLPS